MESHQSQTNYKINNNVFNANYIHNFSKDNIIIIVWKVILERSESLLCEYLWECAHLPQKIILNCNDSIYVCAWIELEPT